MFYFKENNPKAGLINLKRTF